MLITNIEIDEKLVSAGLRITHFKTTKDLVNYALKELVSKKKRKNLIEMKGKVE